MRRERLWKYMELELSGRQRDFLFASADEVLFGGAAGGGKSYGQLIDALLYALRYPGSRQLILRRTYPDLERSLVLVHLSFYPRSLYSYNSSTHRGRFVNGSTLEFGYCDNEKDVYRYQGAEYDTIRFDELTHFTESQYLYLLSRLRGANAYPKQIKSSTNPGGVGHQWVKARFIDPAPAGTPFQAGRRTRIFLPSFVQDNKFLMESDPEYLERLKELPEDKRRALLYGEWDLYEGQFFPEFRRETHVIKPIELPKHWRRYFTMDYGLDMFAAFLIAVDETGHAYVYRECYHSGLIISAAIEKAQEMTKGENVYAFLAPPDLWNRRQETGKSVADYWQAAGFPLTKTSNDRESGWLAVKEWLALRQNEFGERKPNLLVFEGCVNLIRTLPALQHDERRVNDVANEPHELTHAPDALRGFCIYWTTAAEALPGKKAKWSPDQYEDYENATEQDKELLLQKWGNPF